MQIELNNVKEAVSITNKNVLKWRVIDPDKYLSEHFIRSIFISNLVKSCNIKSDNIYFQRLKKTIQINTDNQYLIDSVYFHQSVNNEKFYNLNKDLIILFRSIFEIISYNSLKPEIPQELQKITNHISYINFESIKSIKF